MLERLGYKEFDLGDIPSGASIVQFHNFPASSWKNHVFVHDGWHKIIAVQTSANAEDVMNAVDEVLADKDLNTETIPAISCCGRTDARWDDFTFAIIKDDTVSYLVTNAAGHKEHGVTVSECLRSGAPIAACIQAGWSPFECMAAVQKIQQNMTDTLLPYEMLVAFRKTASRWLPDGLRELVTNGFVIEGDTDNHSYIPLGDGKYGREWAPVYDDDFARKDFCLPLKPLYDNDPYADSDDDGKGEFCEDEIEYVEEDE